jgi:nitroreductase
MQKDSFAKASLIAVYYKKGARDEAWMCIENMLLAAVAEGLGTRIAAFWGGVEKNIDKILGVPEGMELAAAISVGVPEAEAGPRKLRPEGSWLHRNRF